MDDDRTEGAAKNIGGKLKEAAGHVTGDAKLKRDGERDQIEGEAQNEIGGVKDRAREKLDEKDRI